MVAGGRAGRAGPEVPRRWDQRQPVCFDLVESITIVEAGLTPNGVAIDTTHEQAYLACTGTHRFLGPWRAGLLSVVDLASGREVRRIRCGRGTIAVAADPSHQVVYVANLGADSVSVVDAGRGRVRATIRTGRRPRALAVDPSGDCVYVANLGENTVSVLDPRAEAIVATVEVGRGPCAFAQTADGERLYVANFRNASVSVVDTVGRVVTATFAVGDGPGGLALSPSGDRLYVANRWSRSVSVVDLRTEEVRTVPLSTTADRPPLGLGMVTLRAEPYGLAVTAGGARLLVALWEPGTLAVIDTAEERMVGEIDLEGGRHGRGPTDVVGDPDTGILYIACAADALAIVNYPV
jgi:YVTN family beta-propeller protein